MSGPRRPYYPEGTDLSFSPVTPEEECALFDAMRAGDTAARDKIISSHLLFVANEARRLSKGHFAEEDVISAANEALMEAVNKSNFDPRRGNRFTGYLRPFVKVAISQLWKDRDSAARGRNAPPVPKEEHESPVPMTWKVHPPPAEPAEEGETYEETDHNAFLKKMLAECCAVLSEREKRVIHSIYIEDRTCADVGRELKLTRERIRQIESAALEKLKRAFRKRGIPAR